VQKNQLTRLLFTHFRMHPSRLKTTQELLLALFQTRHIQQHRLAAFFSGNFFLSSKIKKVKRFLKHQDLDEAKIAQVVAYFLPKHPWTLALDRTNWKLGQKNINLLTLSVVMDGIAVPLFFKFLDKQGNSNTAERQEILQLFLDTFGVGTIKALLADREFIGESWLEWLSQKRIPFVIRVKKDQTILHSTGQKTTVSKLMTSKQQLVQKTQIAEVACQLTVKTLPSKELLAVISSPGLRHPLDLYRQRWDIETMFKGFKTNGFQLESTHIKELNRLKKLTLLLAIAFAIAVKTGQVQHHKRPIPFRKTVQTRLYSWFRYGLDFLTNIANKLTLKNLEELQKNIPIQWVNST